MSGCHNKGSYWLIQYFPRFFEANYVKMAKGAEICDLETEL